MLAARGIPGHLKGAEDTLSTVKVAGYHLRKGVMSYANHLSCRAVYGPDCDQFDA